MLRRYVKAGLTTIGDRAVTQEYVTVHKQLKAAGRLPIRAVLTSRVDAAKPLEQITNEINRSG
jgi:predicted amidohydrolase YtcJ